jgi:hypothetical protein
MDSPASPEPSPPDPGEPSPPDDDEDITNAPELDGPILFEKTLPPDDRILEPTSDEIFVSPPTSPEDPEVAKAINLLVNRLIPPPPELHGAVSQVLEKRRVEALMDGDYDVAEEQERIAALLQNTIQAEQQKENENRTLDALYQRWQQLQTQQQQISAKWESKLAEFTAQNDRQQQELQAQWDEELEHFLAKWKDPSFLRPFAKPSPKLLQLREQERAMGIARMYPQAKEMKSIADRLQREETQAAQWRINSQMTMERHKLCLKHEKEARAMTVYRDRTIKAIQNDKARELRPILSALQQMKAKKSPMAKYPALPALPPARAESASAACGAENLCSPRTAARYSIFRSEKKTTLLEVSPVDDHTLAQMKKPKTNSTARGRVNTAGH